VPRADWGIPIPGGFFHRETHRYRDEEGCVRPSTTQVFAVEGISDFSMVKEEDLNWKRQYGDAVHEAMQFLVQEDLDWDTVDEAIIAPVTGIECRLKELSFELEAAEESQVVNAFSMRYGMTLDLRGTILYHGRRRHVVIDLKTGSKFSQSWFWQLGGYLVPQPKVPMGWLGIVLQVNPNGEVTPHHVPQVEAAKREFMVLLAAATLKLNHGFATL
jgi:hypothetical protein